MRRTEPPSQERLRTLPQWAQKHIAELTDALKRQTALADDATVAFSRQHGYDEGETDTYLDAGLLDPPVPIGAGVRVDFRTRPSKNASAFDQGRISVAIQRDRNGARYLYVHGSDGALHITPDASNAVRVEVYR